MWIVTNLFYLPNQAFETKSVSKKMFFKLLNGEMMPIAAIFSRVNDKTDRIIPLHSWIQNTKNFKSWLKV